MCACVRACVRVSKEKQFKRYVCVSIESVMYQYNVKSSRFKIFPRFVYLFVFFFQNPDEKNI